MIESVAYRGARSTVLAVGIVCAAQVHANTPAESGSFDAAAQAVTRAAERLEAVRASVDRSQIEIAALARSRSNPSELERFVREEVQYQPYIGVLKGARGALLTRSGNAVDQALLLGAVLEAAGLEVQLVEGTLDGNQADRLVRSASVATIDFPSAVDPERADRRLAGVIRSLGGSPEWSNRATAALEAAPSSPDFDEASAWVEATVARLLEAMDGQDRRPAPDLHSDLVRSAQRYHWIRWRATPSAPWRDAHVAFGDQDPGAIAVERTLDGRLDEGFRHLVEIQVIAERIDDTGRSEHPLHAPWRQSTASLVAVPITLSMLPMDAAGPADLASLDRRIDEVRHFELRINGAPVEGPGSVDLAGRVPARVDDAEAGLGGLASGLGGALTGASADRFSPQSRLSAVFVDYRFDTPAGTHTVRRALVDRLGPAARAAGRSVLDEAIGDADLARALVGERVAMIDVGHLAPAEAADRAAEQVLDKADVFGLMLSAASGAAPDWSRLTFEHVNPLGHLALSAVFDADPGRAPGRLHFRPEAGLIELAVHPMERRDGAVAGYVDIVRNPRLVLVPSESGWRVDFDAAVRAGVWETRMERLAAPAAGEPAFDTFKAFEGDFDMQVFEPAQEATDGPDDADLRARIDAERRAGYRVVVPARSGVRSGWWRVDPVTGQTLGMTSEGRGQAMVEYVETSLKRAQSMYGHFETIVEVAEQLRACREENGGLDQFDDLFCCMASVYVDTASGPAAGQARETGLGGALFVSVLGAAAEAAGGSEQICSDLVANL